LEVTAEIERKAHGFKTSLVHVHKADITRARISLPGEHEQEAVATALGYWDSAIQKTEQLIAAKERHRDALIQRLYALSDAHGNASYFREILEESIEAGNSGRHAKKITVKLYGKGVLAKEEKRQGSEQTQYFVRRAGQLIYSKLDFLNGAFGIVPPELDGFESTLDLPSFDIAPTINPIWLLGYLTRSTYYTRQVGLARGQRKARRVHPSDLLASSLHVPPRDLQDRIAEILTSSQCDIESSKRILESLNTQKRGVMQKLLTGQWRLQLPQATTEEAVEC
jgi:type I restriction enzyme S subunit